MAQDEGMTRFSSNQPQIEATPTRSWAIDEGPCHQVPSWFNPCHFCFFGIDSAECDGCDLRAGARPVYPAGQRVLATLGGE